MSYQAVIFDLDGVIVSTDHYHYIAWKKIADQEGIEFNTQINHRLRGVSRMESLDIILEKANRVYGQEEKEQLAEQKNMYYRESLTLLSDKDLLPGVKETLKQLKLRGIRIAIGSSSKNTPLILRQTGLLEMFDGIADGNMIANSKPHPEVFLLAASKIGVAPEACLVVEDAEAGVEAGLRAGMKVAGVGEAGSCNKVDYSLETVDKLLPLCEV